MDKTLESVILPGLFSEIVGFLDLETAARLREQSTTLRTVLDAELSDETYWKTPVETLVKLDLRAFQLNWQKIYQKIKILGITRTVIEDFPKKLLLQWLKLHFDPDSETITKELIRADRVSVWDDYVSLFQKELAFENHKKFLSWAAESDGGLRIFARLLEEDGQDRTLPDIDSLLTDTMKSKDLAHFMLVEKLYPEYFEDPTLVGNIVRSCIYYVYGSFDVLCYLAYKYPTEVRDSLEEILEDIEVYYRTSSDEIIQMLVKYSSDDHFKTLTNTNSKVYGASLNSLGKALIKDSRLSTKRREELTDLTAKSNAKSARSLSKYLKSTQTDVSTYLSYVPLKDTSDEVLSYLLIAKKMPDKYKKYINMILGYVWTEDVNFPKNLNSPGSGIYTEEEAESLAFELLERIPETAMETDVREYFIHRLRDKPSTHKEDNIYHQIRLKIFQTNI